MNHFDAVEFSEHHSEEVISFFWRSVYKPQWHVIIHMKSLKPGSNSDAQNFFYKNVKDIVLF